MWPGRTSSTPSEGYYRPSLTVEYDEDSAGGDWDFFSGLVRDWERAAWLPPEVARDVRQVVVRSGVVLGRQGGAMKLMVWPFWLGLGGPMGSGQQFMPWIHVDDLSGILAHALEDRRVAGVLNGVAPAQVTNGEFARALARSLSRPSVLPPVPAVVLQALLGTERAVLLLEGQRVIPRRTLQSGYTYLYPELHTALRDIVS
ncbi:epimerase family protein SDR39U1 [Hemiscyllium ocellatum]|uniref:epimerase family protein SDR39U1 n=1 Tax=Hemiscyllium ocellatum TaxID=170820 RepID=UPI0029666420|nr:epimerase family protein SDR39U1 [Hemiscyllium ocellatum]